MEFSELNLTPDLARGIAETGYLTCMPVQEQVLTHAFNGQDLYVQSQTGTGKTAAFLIVIFERLLTEPEIAGKKALIMAPTRELAVQIEEEAKLLARYLPFKIGSFYGGVGYGEQQRLLKENAQILVGTPGRVLDLNHSGWMNLMDLAFLVLDEADRMFDMGFYPDLRKLIKVVPPADRRQTMLFSATLNAWVKNLAWEYTKNPFEIEIEPETVTVEEIDQLLYHVPSGDKLRLLLGILEREQPESAIVFCNTKRYAEIVAKRLRVNGYECEFIMGDLPQSKRLRIIEDVKAGRIRYLVATDVAARGLDIEGLAMVINYDLPSEAENYVHRIGRTARAGKTGRAISLASEQDVYELRPIERYIGKNIPSETAVEELYAGDKSEGMRIHSDFFGGSPRDDRRGPGGGGRREGGRGPGGGGRREGSGRERSGPRQERDRRPERSPRPAGSPERREFPDGAPGEDIAALSFEERMAHYKRKYQGGSPPPGAAPGGRAGPGDGVPGGEGASGEGRGGSARKRRDRGRRGGRPDSGAAQGPGREAQGQEKGRRREGNNGPGQKDGRAGGGYAKNGGSGYRKPGDSRRGDSSRRGQERGGGAAQGGTPAPGAASPKKGILGRLLGLFRK